ncbi:MAG: (2Fe-2S)-binding protein [Proteobacteria bacterium]|nr:(2Fe-2S)-binding protein [Pseudomonadota bacterium]
MKIEFELNGQVVSADVAPDATLLSVLRLDLGLTGTKEGCGVGECGACTVLVNGRAVNSCLYPAVKADGRRVNTVEGLADGDDLSPLQAAFIETGAVQCGFCTPGLLMSAKALLDDKTSPSDEEIVEALEGNLCRCTGYRDILKAVRRAAGRRGEGEP